MRIAKNFHFGAVMRGLWAFLDLSSERDLYCGIIFLHDSLRMAAGGCLAKCGEASDWFCRPPILLTMYHVHTRPASVEVGTLTQPGACCWFHELKQPARMSK
jgi:hypothetical protein